MKPTDVITQHNRREHISHIENFALFGIGVIPVRDYGTLSRGLVEVRGAIVTGYENRQGKMTYRVYGLQADTQPAMLNKDVLLAFNLGNIIPCKYTEFIGQTPIVQDWGGGGDRFEEKTAIYQVAESLTQSFDKLGALQTYHKGPVYPICPFNFMNLSVDEVVIKRQTVGTKFSFGDNGLWGFYTNALAFRPNDLKLFKNIHDNFIAGNSASTVLSIEDATRRAQVSNFRMMSSDVETAIRHYRLANNTRPGVIQMRQNSGFDDGTNLAEATHNWNREAERILQIEASRQQRRRQLEEVRAREELRIRNDLRDSAIPPIMSFYVPSPSIEDGEEVINVPERRKPITGLTSSRKPKAEPKPSKKRINPYGNRERDVEI